MSPREKINIAVIDDQQLFRQGLISLLKENPRKIKPIWLIVE